MIEITADGEISEEELPKLNSIMEKLEILTEAISEMKIVTEKYLKNINT